MKTTFISATFVAMSLTILVAPVLQAQPKNGPASPATGVAVIDMGYIFKNLTRMKQAQERMKTDMQAASDRLQKERKAIQTKMEELKALKVGSPGYKEKEEAIATRQAKLNLDAQLAQKDLREQESKVYYDNLLEVNKVVKDFAERNGIGLVLQYSTAPMDANNPESVAAALSRLVVYQTEKDISDAILKELNRRAVGPVGQRPGTGATR